MHNIYLYILYISAFRCVYNIYIQNVLIYIHMHTYKNIVFIFIFDFVVEPFLTADYYYNSSL